MAIFTRKMFLVSGLIILMLLITSGLVLADSFEYIYEGEFENIYLIQLLTIITDLSNINSENDQEEFYNTLYQKEDETYLCDMFKWGNFVLDVQDNDKNFLSGDNNDFQAYQKGYDNKLKRKQIGTGSGFNRESNHITSRQLGNKNLASQNYYAYKNYLEIVQQGDYNSANQVQNDISWWYWDGCYNDTRSHQYGYYNFSNQIQYGTGNFAMVYQEGGFNTVEQEQVGAFLLFGFGGFNDLIAEQTGTWNYIRQLQYGDKNYAAVYQYGYGNKAKQQQYGFNNSCTIRQNGSSNIAIVKQV